MHRSLIRSTQTSKRALSKVLCQQYQRNRIASRYSSLTATSIRNDNSETANTIQPTRAVNILEERATIASRNEALLPSPQLTKKSKINYSKRSPKSCLDTTLQHIRSKQPELALDTLADMVSDGIKFSIENYNTLLGNLTSRTGAPMQTKVIHLMEQQHVPVTAISYQHVLKGMIWRDEPSAMVEYLDSMKKQGLKPTLHCYYHIVSSCLNTNDSTVAFHLVTEPETGDLSLKTDPQLLTDVLRVCAINDQVEETRYIWNKVANELKLRLDEGSCLQVLRVAANSGDSELATQAIQQLSSNGYSYKEHYFVPLMEAFVANGQMKSAFDVLDIMHESGVAPTLRSTFSISNQISSNVEMVDKAYYTLEEMKAEGKRVDVAAFNIVVSACGLAKDIGRTVATYREASNLDVVPDVNTFNAVLEACIQTDTKGLGNIVFDELKKAKVTPNVDTFSKMITLVCKQANYEDAFVYLEEMKGLGMTPPQQSYFALATKLARERDARFHLALEEMDTYGCKPSAYLKSLWK